MMVVGNTPRKAGGASGSITSEQPSTSSSRVAQTEKVSTSPRVAVIGAGLAGLVAARLLKRSGVNVTLYEGSNRVGGRVRSAVDEIAPGLITELGGEFIDSHHSDMLALASEFGLTLIDTQAESELGLAPGYFFGGQHYNEEQVIAAFEPVARRMQVDVDQLSEEISAYQHSPLDVRLDRLSMAEYLDEIGLSGWLRQLLEVAYVTEYGLDAHELSCLNLLTLLSLDTSDGFQIYGDSDERYKIRGGNAQIAQALACEIGNQIEMDHRLTALRQQGSGFRLNFECGSGARKVEADVVLVAVPFTVLREIELSLEMPTAKRLAIDTLGYGTNEKLILGFESNPWRSQGWDGNAFTDLSFQSGWDSSRLQSQGMAYAFYLGGTPGVRLGEVDQQRLKEQYLREADRMFPGMAAACTSRSIRTGWTRNPFSRGSYTCYKPGQWTTIGGLESETIGNLYFAGEQCSTEFQGFMNGAAASGREAAEAILARIR